MEKLKLWLVKTGLTNIGYAVLFVVAFILQAKLLAGAFLGIFVYINFNVIQKLIKEAISNYKLKQNV